MESLYKNLPETPGIYLMRGSPGRILYIGKAANLRRRVSSYFSRPHDSRIEKLVSEIKRINYEETESALEALILEAKLIKKYKPKYNIREKDDRSFLYIEITKEEFPRILLVRGKSQSSGERFGPFTSSSNIREALRILRKIFPYSVHPVGGRETLRALTASNGIHPAPKTFGLSHGDKPKTKVPRACFDYAIGLCPGTCIGEISREDYLKNIRNLKLIFQGRKKRIISDLEGEMVVASNALDFEKAEKIKRKIFALQHIQDIALISDSELQTTNYKPSTRIEGYDISNISGTYAVGSMVVFRGDKSSRGEYKKFKISTIDGPNDVGMIKEVLKRRMAHREWGMPDLILIDGGKGQVNGAKAVLDESGLKIPVVGIAKGAKRKNNRFVGDTKTIDNSTLDKNILIRVRDEAHRFAISYHKQVRGRKFIN